MPLRTMHPAPSSPVDANVCGGADDSVVSKVEESVASKAEATQVGCWVRRHVHLLHQRELCWMVVGGHGGGPNIGWCVQPGIEWPPGAAVVCGVAGDSTGLV